MQFLDLPNELFVLLGEDLPLSDLNSLLQTNSRLYSLLNTELYRYGANSALLWAAEYGNENLARKALNARASLRALDAEDKTPLIIACQRGHVKVAELLLTRDSSDLNGVVNDWSPLDPQISRRRAAWRTMSPLLFAAQENHAGVVKLLLDQPGVNPHFTDCRGMSVLHYATKDECESVLKLLLENDRTGPVADGAALVLFSFDMKRYSAMSLLLSTGGLEVELSRDEADRLLLQSLNMGLKHIVKKLLVLPSPSTESKYLYEWTTRLAFAVVQSDKAAVTSLLTSTAVDPNHQDILGFTPLSLAVCMGNEDIVRLLLAADHVNPNIPVEQGQTPLWIAAAFGNAEYVKLLLGNDEIDVNLRDRDNQTALVKASELGHVAVVKLLLGHEHIEPDTECDAGWTPLGIAVYNFNHEVAKLLLETNQVDVNADQGGPPLWSAVRYNDLAMVELLLATDGVDPNIVGGILKTHPLSEAVLDGSVEIAERLLLREDIDVNVVNSMGNTPLDSAMLESPGDRKQRMIELLLAKGAVHRQDLLSLNQVPGDA
ncbi:hypothetical protein GX51_02972 [Blastomyces parvus]|uniref:F-box domain-containing protein n=1 Tax=Blastomyces parvus TaxID=2060905 RepID=A0A2B7X9X5_9EURO|nr:hypothetical protein GX51_02972 [Blastomyces parvus]